MIVNNSSIKFNVTKLLRRLRENCSAYNPCGPYGYCNDNWDGEWTCDCKFWWNGTVCDTLSSSGKQVIALGVITAVLVALYYGLTLFHWISKKRREPIKSNTTSIIQGVNRRPYTQINSRTSSSGRIRIWASGIAVLILGIIALIIRGIILQNIHKEIVYKFNHNQSLFYNRPSICGIIYLRDEFNMFTFPLSCLLVLLFTVITKRKSSGQDSYCKGHFAIPIPLDFFAHVKRTFAAITFAIVADELSSIATQFISGNSSSSSLGEGIILTYLVQIIRVLSIGFHYYPILAAVYLNTRFTLICATLYAWFDFSMTIAFNGVCRNDYYSTNENYNKTEGSATISFLEYYGTGSTVVFFQILADIPRYFFLAYICVKLPVLLFKRIRDRKLPGKELTREQKNLLYSSLAYSAESQYVKKLFGLTEKTVPRNRIIRLFQSIYTWRDDFRFSSRVFCAYASVFFLLFFITVQACVRGLPLLSESSDPGLKSILTPKNVRNANSQKIGDSSSDTPVASFVRPFLFGICTALIVTTIQLFILLSSIRRNLLQVFRGNDSEIPRRDAKLNVNYAIDNIHFAGYLIGYVLWGYVLIAIIAAIFEFIIDVLIITGSISIAEYILKIIIPPALFALFQNYVNKILGQYVFLQQAGDVLSINHRRVLMVFLYFNFFLDALLGFFSSVIRILKSTVGGIIFMCRLDYSWLGRKLETYDAGFSAYCGFIHMECAHRHPVLLYFTSLLIREHLYGTEEIRCSRARRRWYLAIFLLKNPTLIYRRKSFFVQSHTNETKVVMIARRNMKTMTIEDPSNAFQLQNTTY